MMDGAPGSSSISSNGPDRALAGAFRKRLSIMPARRTSAAPASLRPIRFDGQVKRVSAAEAVVLQLMQKALTGKPRAWRAVLKYQEFANSHTRKGTRLNFVENDYTSYCSRNSLRVTRMTEYEVGYGRPKSGPLPPWSVRQSQRTRQAQACADCRDD